MVVFDLVIVDQRLLFYHFLKFFPVFPCKIVIRRLGKRYLYFFHCLIET